MADKPGTCTDERIELNRQVETNLAALRRTEAAVARVKEAERRLKAPAAQKA